MHGKKSQCRKWTPHYYGRDFLQLYYYIYAVIFIACLGISMVGRVLTGSRTFTTGTIMTATLTKMMSTRKGLTTSFRTLPHGLVARSLCRVLATTTLLDTEKEK